MRDQLTSIPGVTVRDLGTEKSGLVSFTVAGIAPQTLRSKLAEKRITIAANGIPYTPLDMTARGLNEVARASVSYLNTIDEIDRLCDNVAALA
ncbi:hercynylcysteine sulfoxide lyase [compost metagenome]